MSKYNIYMYMYVCMNIIIRSTCIYIAHEHNNYTIYMCMLQLQSVLDSTYHQECHLVEGGFPDDITKREIADIIGKEWVLKCEGRCPQCDDVVYMLWTE